MPKKNQRGDPLVLTDFISLLNNLKSEMGDPFEIYLFTLNPVWGVMLSNGSP